MKVNIQGLINRLESLMVRLNDLFDNLEELEQEDIEIENVQQYFQNDDALNLSFTLAVLEQVDKLDEALDIIKDKMVNVEALFYSSSCEDYNKHYTHYKDLTQEEYDLLKEVLL